MGFDPAKVLWRFVVTDLDHVTLTFLDPLAHDRQVTVSRNAPRTVHCSVPSDNPEVNILADEGSLVQEPFVAEGTRFLLAFRREGREGTMDNPWKIRASTLIMEANDSGDEDQPVTRLVGYDPWKYLYRRPVLLASGNLPDESGKAYPFGTSADEIIVDQFELADANGTGLFIDYGQTAFYDGTIQACDPLPNEGDGLAIRFSPATSLGEMLDAMVATGTCDIVLDPIYDPENRPGILCELSIYQSAGSFQADAILGWDSFPKNVVAIDRAVSGLERANNIKFFIGQGGPPTTLETDAGSVAKYGDYYLQQFLVGLQSIGAAHDAANRQLELVADGPVTYQLSLAAQRAPFLFLEYRENDTLPVYASNRLRKSIPGDVVRVEQIPIVIGDDQLERVDNLLVSFVEAGS